MYIYVSGPYSAPSPTQILANVYKAIDAGIAILFKGHVPFIPHLTHFLSARLRETGKDFSWEFYMRYDLAWLEKCDALLYLAPSKGADIELKAAIRMGKEIFCSIDEIPVSKAGDRSCIRTQK